MKHTLVAFLIENAFITMSYCTVVFTGLLVGSSVVRDEECPASVITAVLVATMEAIMEWKKSASPISSSTSTNKREYLYPLYQYRLQPGHPP